MYIGPIRNLWMVSKPASQLQSRPSGFEAGYLFYTINLRHEILHWWFVIKNLETTVWMIPFVINVANCSNDGRIGWPLWKQASTVLVFVQPVSELTKKLSSCYRVSVHQRASKPSTLSQPVSKLSTQPISKRAITFHRFMNRASPFKSRLACFETGRQASKRAGCKLGLNKFAVRTRTAQRGAY